MDRWLGRYSPHAYALLRIVAAFLFITHGAQKFGLIQAPPAPAGRAQAAGRAGSPPQGAQTAVPRQPQPGAEAGAPTSPAQPAAAARPRGLRMPRGRALVAALIEMIGGTMIMFGLFTSWIAFLASGEMAFAYFLSHAPRNVIPLFNGGEPAVFLCFIWLCMATRPPDRWALDNVLFRR